MNLNADCAYKVVEVPPEKLCAPHLGFSSQVLNRLKFIRGGVGSLRAWSLCHSLWAFKKIDHY